MKLLLSLFLFSVSIGAFAQDDKPKANPPKTEAYILKSSALEIKRGIDSDSNNFYPKINAGKMWVFQYNYTAAEYPEISDDEYADALTFQLPPQTGTSFKLTGKALANANTVFQKACFCADRGYFRIKEGTITGTRLNSTTWVVNIEIVIPPKSEISAGPIRKKFTARYKIQAK